LIRKKKQQPTCRRIRIKLPKAATTEEDGDDGDAASLFDDEDSLFTQEDRDVIEEKGEDDHEDDDNTRDVFEEDEDNTMKDDFDNVVLNFEEEDNTGEGDVFYDGAFLNNKFFFKEDTTNLMMSELEESDEDEDNKNGRRSSARVRKAKKAGKKAVVVKEKKAVMVKKKKKAPAVVVVPVPAKKKTVVLLGSVVVAATAAATKQKKQTKVVASKKNKTTKPTIKLLEAGGKKYRDLVMHWMTTTKAILKEAGVASPRQTWADDFQSLLETQPMLYAWYTCCGMLASMKNKDENVTQFMTLLRDGGFTPAYIRNRVLEKGHKFVHEEVAVMARGSFHLKAATNVLLLSKDFEELRLWEEVPWKRMQAIVSGLGPKCAIILFEMWHPGSNPGIAVDIHVLTLAKSLGIFSYDCTNQELVQNTLESFIEIGKWREVNLVFGSLFQFLHMSRGEEGYL
jgi:endonuclease III